MSADVRDDLVMQVRDALRGVIDPELGFNVVDLGFIYDIRIEEGTAHILMTATTPGCPATGFLTEGVAHGATAVPGIAKADVTLTFAPAWTPELMTDEAKAELGYGRGN